MGTKTRLMRRGIAVAVTAVVMVTGVAAGGGAETTDEPSSTTSTTPTSESTTTTAPEVTTTAPSSTTSAPTTAPPTTAAPIPTGMPGAPRWWGMPTGGGDVGVEVVGGSTVPSDRSYPFVAAIFPKVNGPLGTICGGTLIARYWIVTAAHCVDGAAPSQVGVALGKRNLATIPASAVRSVDRVIIKAQYAGIPSQNDIALLRLTQPVPTSVATPLPLIPDPRFASFNLPAWVLGWGSITNPTSGNPNGTQAYGMRIGAVNIFAGSKSPTCGEWKPEHGFIYTLALCAGKPYPTGGTTASCIGDSGGPLYIKLSNNKRYLAGIVAAGYRAGVGQPIQCTNAPPGFVPLYTRVSTYVNWIKTWVNSKR